MGFFQKFNSGQNQFELEMWATFLNISNNIFEILKFLQKWDIFLIIVKHTTRNMSVLNYEHVLVDMGLKSFFSNFFEKWYKFAKLSNFGEFLLEMLPDFVGAFKVGFVSGE